MVVLTPENPEASIVLIGSTGVWKSAVGQELAHLLGWTLVELDDLRAAWYREFGLRPETERDAWERGGLPEVVATWKPYELQSVQRVMREHPTRSVIAFGGGQSVYVDDAMIATAREALAPAGRVILLLPSEHSAESMRILQYRLRAIPFVAGQPDREAFIRNFTPVLQMQLQSDSNRLLATEIIITGHSTPAELAQHIATTMNQE